MEENTIAIGGTTYVVSRTFGQEESVREMVVTKLTNAISPVALDSNPPS